MAILKVWDNDNSDWLVPTNNATDHIMEAAKQAALEATYPVGSTYWNGSDSRNPSEIFGFGTWAALEGVVLGGRSSSGPFNVAAGTIIGADTHTLTANQSGLRAHGHQFRDGNRYGADSSWDTGQIYAPRPSTSNVRVWAANGTPGVIDAPAQNASEAHNNIQRTKIGYLWERTA